MLIDVPACDRSAENSHWNYFVQLGPRELIVSNLYVVVELA